MDNHGEQNQETETEHTSQNDSASSENFEEFSLPETPEYLSDNPEELKPLIFERDQAIEALRQRNLELHSKLTEREKVVTALTSRLEQAAEQLDRLHRSGADRGGKLLSGIPAEVIDEQRALINDLKSAISHWEDMQSTSAMGRFEAQLSELREMLAEQLKLKNKLPSADSSKPFAKSSPHTTPQPQQEAGSGSWDEMKARLLGESGHSSPDESSDIKIPGTEMIPGAETTASTDDDNAQESEFSLTIRERPPVVENIDQASAETLREAVKSRDEHIDHLLEAIETLKERAGTVDLEESRQRQHELEEKLRKSEIEMSMERAKLAREEMRLRQLNQELSNPSAKKKNDEKPSDSDEEGGNRWVRFLGSK